MIGTRIKESLLFAVAAPIVLAILGGTSWAFSHIAGFSLRQSVILVLFATVICHLWAAECLRRRVDRQIPFRPFSFWIRPNWDVLLKDYGLWSEFLASIPERRGDGEDASGSSTPDSIRVSSLTATLYSINGGFTTRLKEYVYAWDPGEVLVRDPIEQPSSPWPPQFYVKESREQRVSGDILVYEFGLVTNESLRKSRSYDLMFGHGLPNDAHIPIAKLPFVVFGGYRGGCESIADEMIQRQKNADQLLQEYGWREEEHPLPRITRVTHKYVQIDHWSI